MWKYALLSKTAKAAGGPEQYVTMIQEGAKRIGLIEGRRSMYPWIGGAALVSSGITLIIKKAIEVTEKKKQDAQLVLDEGKKGLINGIKNYDSTESRIDEGNSDE